MKQPLVGGRRLPRNDWEGDDFTPGAGGAFVTCQDTAAGRAVAFATNGKIDLDGKIYRAAVPGHDPNGISLQQAKIAVAKVAHRELVIPGPFTPRMALDHLKAQKGLIINGRYEAIPRAFRYQANADFNHGIWCSHYSSTSGTRAWDPLNPDTTAYGRWIPWVIIRDFLESLGGLVGYVVLDPL